MRDREKKANSFKIEYGGSVDCLRLEDKEDISPSEQASTGARNHVQLNLCHIISVIWKEDV